ncbi:hypothetical protein F5X68DRAFT_18013 [Plectosphaerella plurivora]|uniref:Uncharacterized protein n=1 Tax=Plectosphaerella plurivora TaxID=936078 RepID=A0A9P9ABS9_9PEZI|nr:hypothetical protein F5X68DRAFT_18013 [Plectosphaerella plurivora]
MRPLFDSSLRPGAPLETRAPNVLPRSSKMPMTNPPSRHAPMEAVILPERQVSGQMGNQSVVSKPPVAEPRPDAEPNLTLRGGGMSLGFDCCGGSCRFHKSCC